MASALGLALLLPAASGLRELLLYLLLCVMLVYTTSLACKAPDYPGRRGSLILETAALLGVLLFWHRGDLGVSTLIVNAYLLAAFANAAIWVIGRSAAAAADEAGPQARDAFAAVCLSHLVMAALLPLVLVAARAGWGETTLFLAFALLFAGGWGLQVARDLAAFKPSVVRRRVST